MVRLPFLAVGLASGNQPDPRAAPGVNHSHNSQPTQLPVADPSLLAVGVSIIPSSEHRPIENGSRFLEA
jgi:hypothetical protein